MQSYCNFVETIIQICMISSAELTSESSFNAVIPEIRKEDEEYLGELAGAEGCLEDV
jgi:hypothetical protein